MLKNLIGENRKRTKVLTIDADLCTNCRSCELACSAFNFKLSNPMRSMIEVIYDFKRNIAVPIVCRDCEDPPCQKVCPVNAIFRNHDTNAVVINNEKCIGCNLCITACRLGGPSVDIASGKVIMCNLCGGDPQCVKVCSLKALTFTEDFRVGTETRRTKLRKLIDALDWVRT